MTKSLSELNPEDQREAKRSFAELIHSLLHPGDLFLLVIFDRTGVAHYISSAERAGMADGLRQLADTIESDWKNRC